MEFYCHLSLILIFTLPLISLPPWKFAYVSK